MSDVIFSKKDSAGNVLEVQDGASGVFLNIFDAFEVCSFKIDDWETALELFTWIITSKNIPYAVDKDNLKLSIDSRK